MATITTNASVIRQYNAFTGLSARERSQSGVARAEVVYYNVNDNWGAPGAGNNRIYQIAQTSLPNDFGYVLTDAYIKIASTGSEISAEAAGELRLFPGGLLGPMINVELTSAPSRMNHLGAENLSSGASYNTTKFGSDGIMIYQMLSKPTAVLYPFGSNAYTTASNPTSTFYVKLGEEVANGSAYEVTCYLRFLQYDIDQSYNYVIQSPQLTR